ncbi:MAG: hypothetical protein ABUS49_07540, partial [Acidobacteriota bacterium]
MCDSASAQLTITGYGGATAFVSPNGAWNVSVPGPYWNFSGNIGAPAIAARFASGTDGMGAYQEIAFDYRIGGGSRTASIRVYEGRPAVLFSVTWNDAAANATPFPAIFAYPSALSHLTFNG